MMKALPLLVFGLAAVSSVAAPPASKNFEDFRRGMYQRYDNFREEMLADYAKFLDGEWVEFKWFPAEERDVTPKPVKAPEAPADAPSENTVIAGPTIISETPEPDGPATNTRPDAGKAHDVVPVPEPDFTFDFYGIQLGMPNIDLQIINSMGSTADYAQQWRELASTSDARTMTDAIAALAAGHNFNDYLTFDLVRHYALARFPQASPASRTSLVHYIMTNLGYDARIGSTADGNAVIMMPCRQKVYGQTYLLFGNEKYYIFTDLKANLDTRRAAIASCQLPAVANQGRKIDLRLSPVNIPSNPKDFTISDGNLTVSGTVNENLFPIIYRYPQMPIGDYAESTIEPSTRNSIVEQLKKQLDGKPQDQAVNELLAFVQNGFKYATDEQAHGFEKPYFFEETLFYPECDCEDRVIFYTFLLWNVLGVENHLLGFPGHESASVTLSSDIKGDSYTYDNKRFFISDPTFIGAKTGMCMPSYKSQVPEIDHIYK